MVQPNGIIKLCNVPLKQQQEDTFLFSSVDKQLEYFNSKVGHSVPNCTLTRENGTINYPLSIEQVEKYNYIMYQNLDFENKWFYGFITSINYLNPNCTEINFEIDVIQTWMFEMNLNQCFIERECVNDDTIGKHTIPENLETGEYIISSKDTIQYSKDDLIYVIGSSMDLEKDPTNNMFPISKQQRVYNGIPSGVVYWGTPDIVSFSSKLGDIDEFGQSNNVASVFVAPKFLCPFASGKTEGNIKTSEIDFNQNYIFNKHRVIGNSLYGSYTPKNNKLLTGEYNYLIVDNGLGGSVKYNYEDFEDWGAGKFSLDVHGCLTPGCNIKLYPIGYKNKYRTDFQSFYNLDAINALTCGKFPLLNWKNDQYNIQLQQALKNIPTEIGTKIIPSLMSLFTGILTESPFVIAGSGVSIENSLLQANMSLTRLYNAEPFTPTTNQGNINTGDVTLVNNTFGFRLYNMTIKPEYAKVIDNYFSMYGYKVNEVKTPNIRGRKYWNYIKTINSNVTGNFNQNDLDKINALFDKGIRFWHNPNNIYNYGLNNTIV